MLHKKILELREKVRNKPINLWKPNRSKYDALPIERRSAKTSSDNERTIKQYFCIFGIPDDYQTVPVRGAFAKSIAERGPGTGVTNLIKVLNQHNPLKPLCNPSVLIEDEIGLYGEYTPDEGITENDDLVIRVKRGTINNGSYGFQYVWDKMTYDDNTGLIIMNEINLEEVSPVTFGSQKETYVVRSRDGKYYDEFLADDLEEFLNKIPRALRLTAKSLIDRHITLAKLEPDEDVENQNPLEVREPKVEKVNYGYLINNLNF